MLSESIRLQYAGTNVKVVELVPPAVRTALLPGQEDSEFAMPLDDYADEAVALLQAQPALHPGVRAAAPRALRHQKPLPEPGQNKISSECPRFEGNPARDTTLAGDKPLAGRNLLCRFDGVSVKIRWNRGSRRVVQIGRHGVLLAQAGLGYCARGAGRARRCALAKGRDMRALRNSRDGLRVNWATRMGRICCAVAIVAGIGVSEFGTAPASTAATTGLVAAYGFDEGSGTTVTDASGNGNNGTVTNTTWSTSGKYGGALQFNGTNALVTVPDTASLHLSSGMTLEAWVNPSTVTAKWRDVIYKGNDNFYLEATSTNASKPDAGMIAGGSYADAIGTAKLTASTWSFLTETYDGSTLRLYVNGTQVASTAHTGTIATSTNPLQIGGDSIYGQYFAGLIDNVRVYNVALSAAQIQTDMTTPVNNGPDTTAPTQPGTLSTNVVSASEVDLSWGASTDNVGVTGYQVERCSGTGCTNFAQIGTTTGTGTTYKDTSTVASTTYSYRVRATDAAGNLSTYSNTASATTPTPDTTAADAAGDAEHQRGQRQ